MQLYIFFSKCCCFQNSSSSSFQGTGLSLFQNDLHSPDNGFVGLQRDLDMVDGVRNMTELPVSYSDVKPTTLGSNKIYVPE